MSKRIQIAGRINEMALPTVRELIGLTQWQAITALDAEPTFVEMVIAHEGTSRGEIVGWGARLKEWGKRVIRSVVQAFAPSGKVPVRIYDGVDHWHGNQAQRVPVGEVIHSFDYEANGVTEARVIGWIYPRFKVIAGERDCCSMEIDGLVVEVNGHSVVEEIFQAVAVVLGHTSKQTPGFAGARVQAITEFGPEDSGSEKPAGETTGMGASAPSAGGEVAPASPTFSKADLISAIKEAGIQPGDIWPVPVAPAPMPLPAAVATPAEKPAAPAIDPLTMGNPFLPA